MPFAPRSRFAAAAVLLSLFPLLSAEGAQTSPASLPAPSARVRSLPPAPPPGALPRHDLAWIKTRNDFAQDALTAARIDERIARIVRGYDREQPVATFEVPVNTKRLRYLGRQRYAAFDRRIRGLRIAEAGGPLDREAHFYRYGGGGVPSFTVAVPGDGPEDQLRVHALCRALEILRYRYPAAYRRLFADVQVFPAAAPSQGGFRHKRRFDTILFSFDESPVAIAAGITPEPDGYGPEQARDQEELALVSFGYTAMRGREANDRGSHLLYQSTPDENFARFLREGLIESMVHEMLHRVIDYRSPFDRTAFALWSERRDASALSNRDPKTAVAGEEAVVVATSTRYFLREGGIQQGLLFWHRGPLNVNITNLQTARALDNYLALVNADPARGSLYVKRLALTLLDN